MRCCVYTRAFLERAYIISFIEHYVMLGFDKIIILKADNTCYTCPPEYLKYVEFHSVKNEADLILPNHIDKIKNSKFDWILSVDIDEFLIIHKRYKHIKHYISYHIKRNPTINGFMFRWGMIEKYDNDDGLKFNELLTKYKIFANPHIKSLIKRTSLDYISNPHYFKFNEEPVIHFENQIYNKPSPLHDLSNDSYKDAILIHVHTRSINNIISKSYDTALTEKIIKNAEKFANLVNEESLDNCFPKFKEVIGLKATLPFIHSVTMKGHLVTDLSDFKIFEYVNLFINSPLETLDMTNLLKRESIDLDKYNLFVHELALLAKPSFKL